MAADIQLVQPENPNPVLRQPGPQVLVPASVLFVDKIVRRPVDQIPFLHQGQAVGRAFVVPVFDLLQQDATRTSKNSSRLLAEMDRNFNRSSNGLLGSAASSSTRRLNFSQEARG